MPPLAFLVLMISWAPFKYVGDFDYDEGINLAKALLMIKGYPLYAEVWSDQPPLMTAMLAGWIRAFGISVEAARVLIILLSTLLVWAAYRVARESVSTGAALAAATLLVLSEDYIRLSTSVMIGLPALALGMLAVALILPGVSKRNPWLIAVSGGFMGLALQTKLLAGVIAPAVLAHILLAHLSERGGRTPLKRGLQQAFWWLAATGVVFVGIGLLFGSLTADLLLFHVGPDTRDAFHLTNTIAFLRAFAKEHLVYGLLAAVGVYWAARSRSTAVILPLVWLLTSALAVMVSRPIWYHHVTLLTIPLAWLTAFGVEAWIQTFGPFGRQRSLASLDSRALVPMGMGLTILVLIVLYPKPLPARLAEYMHRSRPTYTLEIVDQLRQDAQVEPGWVYTDRPFYAFQAQMAVPPPMAVLSRKRLASGLISEQALADTLVTYQPRFIVIERFPLAFGELAYDEIGRRYDLVLAAGQARYFIRSDDKSSSMQ